MYGLNLLGNWLWESLELGLDIYNIAPSSFLTVNHHSHNDNIYRVLLRFLYQSEFPIT